MNVLIAQWEMTLISLYLNVKGGTIQVDGPYMQINFDYMTNSPYGNMKNACIGR